jgi:hypothetical protein
MVDAAAHFARFFAGSTTSRPTCPTILPGTAYIYYPDLLLYTYAAYRPSMF